MGDKRITRAWADSIEFSEGTVLKFSLGDNASALIRCCEDEIR